MDFLNVTYLRDYVQAFNSVDYAIAAILAISSLIGIRIGIKRELLALMVMVVPSAATVFVPTDLLEDYLAEIIINKQFIKISASFIVCVVFFFITVVIKKSILSKAKPRGSILSFDAILGLLYGAARGYIIVIFLIVAHAHFFKVPIEAMTKSIMVRDVKNHLLGIDVKFEKLLEHTDSQALEAEQAIFTAIKKDGAKANQKPKVVKGNGKINEDKPIVDVTSDEETPDIEP